MRSVYYKATNYPENVASNSLPNNFVTEWTYQDSQPDTFDTSGWLSLQEDEFLVLLSQNQSKLDAFDTLRNAAALTPNDGYV